jgi:hypothetical protein
MEKLIKSSNGQWKIVGEMNTVKEAMEHLAKAATIIPFPSGKKQPNDVHPAVDSGSIGAQVTQIPGSTEAARRMHNERVQVEADKQSKKNGSRKAGEGSMRDIAAGTTPSGSTITAEDDGTHRIWRPHNLDPKHVLSIKGSLLDHLDGSSDGNWADNEYPIHDVDFHPLDNGNHQVSIVHNKEDPSGKTKPQEYINRLTSNIRDALAEHGTVVGHSAHGLPGNRALSSVEVKLAPYGSMTAHKGRYRDFF